MKKRHYIQLVILLIASCFYLAAKRGGIKEVDTNVPSPLIDGVMTVSYTEPRIDYSGTDAIPTENLRTHPEKSTYTEVTFNGRFIRIDRSDYETDAAYWEAVEHAKIEITAPQDRLIVQ